MKLEMTTWTKDQFEEKSRAYETEIEKIVLWFDYLKYNLPRFEWNIEMKLDN